MTDQKIESLKIRIEATMDRLEKLQAQYREETGGDFVRPLRLAPARGTIMEDIEGLLALVPT